jgi:hypothetical protein
MDGEGREGEADSTRAVQFKFLLKHLYRELWDTCITLSLEVNSTSVQSSAQVS